MEELTIEELATATAIPVRDFLDRFREMSADDLGQLSMMCKGAHLFFEVTNKTIKP